MLSAALISPFARAQLPQSHRLRLSCNCVYHVTTLNHRFENDYSQLAGICQASFSEKLIPNIKITFAAAMFGKTELLQKCDTRTFRYELCMRQNIMILCYIWMKLPKSLDRFRRSCYNNQCCRRKYNENCGSDAILENDTARETRQRKNSQISERENAMFHRKRACFGE